MNLFELAAVVTPLAGAISAGYAAASLGLWRCVGFSIGGLILGVALYFLSLGLLSLVGRLRGSTDRRSVLSGLPVFALFVTILSPLIAIFLGRFLVHYLA